MLEKSINDYPQWARAPKLFIKGVQNLLDDIFEFIGFDGGNDEFFNTERGLSPKANTHLAHLLMRLRHAGFEGARLKFGIGDNLRSEFNSRAITDVVNALLDRDFKELRSASQRLDDELAAFVLEISNALTLAPTDRNGVQKMNGVDLILLVIGRSCSATAKELFLNTERTGTVIPPLRSGGLAQRQRREIFNSGLISWTRNFHISALPTAGQERRKRNRIGNFRNLSAISVDSDVRL